MLLFIPLMITTSYVFAKPCNEHRSPVVLFLNDKLGRGAELVLVQNRTVQALEPVDSFDRREELLRGFEEGEICIPLEQAIIEGGKSFSDGITMLSGILNSTLSGSDFWFVFGVAGRTVFLAFACCGIGLALFNVLFLGARPALASPSGRLIMTSLAALPVLGMVAVSLTGVSITGSGAGGLLMPASYARGFDTNLGYAIVWTTIGFCLMVPGLLWRNLLGTALFWLSLACLLISFALCGHTGTLNPRLLSSTALVIHIGIAAFWIGGLLVLWFLCGQLPHTAMAKTLHRFSMIAMPAVGLLLIAGIGLTLRHIHSLSALFFSGFGNILITKILIVGFVLLLALSNKTIVTNAFAKNDSKACYLLKRNLALEIGSIFFVLIMTAALTKSETPHHQMNSNSTRTATNAEHFYAPGSSKTDSFQHQSRAQFRIRLNNEKTLRDRLNAHAFDHLIQSNLVFSEVVVRAGNTNKH